LRLPVQPFKAGLLPFHLIFDHFVNRLSLAGDDKLFARKITIGTEYSLEKYQPFGFDDFIKIDNRTIQRVLRELDSQILAFALKDAKKEVEDVFLGICQNVG